MSEEVTVVKALDEEVEKGAMPPPVRTPFHEIAVEVKTKKKQGGGGDDVSMASDSQSQQLLTQSQTPSIIQTQSQTPDNKKPMSQLQQEMTRGSSQHQTAIDGDADDDSYNFHEDIRKEMDDARAETNKELDGSDDRVMISLSTKEMKVESAVRYLMRWVSKRWPLKSIPICASRSSHQKAHQTQKSTSGSSSGHRGY